MVDRSLPASAASEDSGLRAALEESVRSCSAISAPLVLPATGCNAGKTRRAARARPLAHHFGARAGCARDGDIHSLPGLNQFSDVFRPLCARHGTAESICGYTTFAVATILVERVRELRGAGFASISPELLHEAVVANVPRFMREVEKSMAHVRQSREAWILSHPELFSTERSKKNHLQGWIANYELSDLIATFIAPNLDDVAAPPVDFVRFNQWHEVSSATPDERVNIERDEKRFGGRTDATRPGNVIFKEGESKFIVERFGKEGLRCLQSPEEWWDAEALHLANTSCNQQEDNDNLRIFCMDLNGHFSAGWSVEPGRLFFINTTKSAYADKAIVDWYYDLRFPPFRDAAGKDASSCQVCVQDGPDESAAEGAGSHSVGHDVKQLIEMGFPVDQIKQALEAAHGNTASAIEMLLSGVL